ARQRDYLLTYVIRHGLFIGLDDGFPASSSVSVMSGNLSAAILHAEFKSRCPDVTWQLAIADSIFRLNRVNLLKSLRQFLVDTPSTEAAIIYLAGHVCSFQGRYVFCPQDFDMHFPDATGLTLDLFNTLVERFNPPGRRLFLFFDTCRTLLDTAPEGGELAPPNCSLLYTCKHGEDIVEIDGYSDFVRGLITIMSEAAHAGQVRLSLAEAIGDLQHARVREGSGRPLHIGLGGQTLEEAYLFVQTETKNSNLRPIRCHLDSPART